MRTTVHIIRSILYFPVEFLQYIHLSNPLRTSIVRFIVKVDAPLRRYLLGGRYEV